MSDAPRKPPRGPSTPGRTPARPAAPRAPSATKPPAAKPQAKPVASASAAKPFAPKAPPPKGPPRSAPPGGVALDPNNVYLVESDVDPTALIGRHAGIREGHVFWDDTNRERIQEVASAIAEPSGTIVVRTRQPGLAYRFTPLTLELYEEKVRRRVELCPRFESTQAVIRFYREASF